MRLRGERAPPLNVSEESVIRKVLAVDGFEIQNLDFKNDSVNIMVKNTKFRSTAQAVGRVASTLQRFAADNVQNANIAFYSNGLHTATYRVNLEKITTEQFDLTSSIIHDPSIVAVDIDVMQPAKNSQRFKWGLGPYVAHRLFNPDLPLSAETGIEFGAAYQITPTLKIAGSLPKSFDQQQQQRRSGSALPVQTEWPLYDLRAVRTFTNSHCLMSKFSPRTL